jgi:hypothetical protein
MIIFGIISEKVSSRRSHIRLPVHGSPEKIPDDKKEQELKDILIRQHTSKFRVGVQNMITIRT